MRKDGSSFVAEIRADVVVLNDEKNFLVYLRDISETDRIQRKLQLALCSIEDSLDAVYWVRPDTSFAYVNNSACRALDYTRDELLSMTVLDVNPQLSKEALYERMNTVRAHGSVFVESTHKTRSGRLFPVELMIGHLLEDGEEYFYVSARDLTERKRSESEIQKSARRIRSIIDSASDAIIVFDEEHTVVEWNPQAERIFGWKAHEVLNEDSGRFLAGENGAEGLDQLFADVDKPGSPTVACRTKLELSSKTGERIPVEVNISRAMTPEGVTHTTFIRDLRLQRKLEEQSIRADKLESVGVLAGGIAHDFNNLLTGVLGNIALATRSGDLGPKVREYLDEAEQALSKASDLTRQLLTFSKGGAPIREVSSIESLLVETVTFALRGATSKPVFVIPDNLYAVEMDCSQISQVLHNLCINATQAMPDGGIVTVRAENVNYKSAPGVRIKLSDKGTGISKENLKKIFDPFFTTKPTGNGLGLATSYSIIKKHGGTIGVESEVNKGTTFTIELPATLRDVKTNMSRERASLTGQGRILVMDDEAFLRRLAKSMIEGYGYTVETSADGLEALAKY
ncbi:MAG: PAS domain S-box protein, partial [Candidatus Zixiibacteriota bacterium]